jgi:transcriptional regulator with GAF, ATPase, and Fis domain
VEHALIRHKGNYESRPLCARDFFFLRPANGPGIAHESVQHGSTFPTLDELQTIHIRKALQLSDGKIQGRGGAAERLGVKPTTLRYRMDKLGIPFRKRQQG